MIYNLLDHFFFLKKLLIQNLNKLYIKINIKSLKFNYSIKIYKVNIFLKVTNKC